MFEGELITIKGAIFGRMLINSVCISFKSEDRKLGRKYRFGSTVPNQINKKINKKWKLDSIKEVVLKRYNLIRQAVEIYFENSRSVFISFFSVKNRVRFVNALKEEAPKRSKSFEIIEDPELYFRSKEYTKKWQQCDISNFEYLTLLNKYSGRTFHDFGQYPIFPWIIQDYTSQNLDLSSQLIYRNLELPIAAISYIKRKEAESKSEDLPVIPEELLFRYDSHYLTAKAVLGYLFRLEPYASLVVLPEQGQDHAGEIFHFLEKTWENCISHPNNNKELIPEFYYLPELFGNYNKCSFGTRKLDSERRVRVDQVILPPWASSNHHFVQMNSLALENKQTSSNLNYWIDLIFGSKQQDPNSFNQFPELCDEAKVAKKLHILTKKDYAEIQLNGNNPIRMFNEKHPQRDIDEYSKRTNYSIFLRENIGCKKFFAILLAHNFKSAVTYIEPYTSKIIVVLNDQTVCKTTEDKYINAPFENVFSFKTSKIPLFPFKKMYVDGSSHLTCDARRSIVSLEEGKYVITCRHYDNSCKIVDTDTGKVKQHLYFHKALVFTICATKDRKLLFSGSLDGMVARWDISICTTQLAHTVWYACDHKLAVITMDACRELDLIASGSLDGTIALRVVSTGKFVRLVKPELHLGGTEYALNQVRLSYRGYILVLCRCKYPKLDINDYILVYSINGECIKQAPVEDIVNAISLDESGYQFVTGGKSGRLYRFDLLSLECSDMLELLDEQLLDIEEILKHILSSSTSITAFGLTKQEKFQQLLIGLNTGELYSFKYSPRRMFDNFFMVLNNT